MIGLLAYLALLFAVLILGGGSAWLRVRRQRAAMVVQYLASTVAQNLPLVPALRLAAAAERRGLRRALERVATRLEIGEPLGTALGWALPSIPGTVLGAVQGAERGGTLPAVLQDLAQREQHGAADRTRGFPLWYPLLLTVVMPAVVALFLVHIVPKYEDIFRDFECTLPAVTAGFISFADKLGWALPVAGVLLVLMVVQSWLAWQFAPRAAGRFQLHFAAWDALTWCLPLVRQGVRHRALARQLPVLQAAVRAGHDLSAAARQAACVATNTFARRCLLRWARELAGGADPAAAAARAGLPGPVCSALRRGGQPAELAARLEYLAGYYDALGLHWERLALAVVTPLMVVLWGLCVGYLALVLILPLVTLVDSVARSIE